MEVARSARAAYRFLRAHIRPRPGQVSLGAIAWAPARGEISRSREGVSGLVLSTPVRLTVNQVTMCVTFEPRIKTDV